MTLSRDVLIRWMHLFAQSVEANKNYLTELDSAIGDADHGANMHRGMQAVLGKLPSVAESDIGSILKTVGMTLVSTVGGASGPLYGTFFIQMASGASNKMELTLEDYTNALQSGINGIVMRGKAQLKDKTMLDALQPALDALKHAVESGASLEEALQQSAEAAAAGRDSTTPLIARKGRASYLGDRSIGHQDPGATSSHLLLQSLVDAVKG
ncbi:dihydroxyacetone kinase subunit L [Fischerella thermalis CCMEE 5330]|uniref:Dihydroxyacetone kinase subunit L n=1 Tax=Fischerella thermalis CCMEE 5330 TaxID=2019670 RepID=A0A2N6MND7_9CYAN|nr:dihydroxyacetone kinase subunit L [Fischerella thermalis CCMEE 5330]